MHIRSWYDKKRENKTIFFKELVKSSFVLDFFDNLPVLNQYVYDFDQSESINQFFEGFSKYAPFPAEKIELCYYELD